MNNEFEKDIDKRYIFDLFLSSMKEKFSEEKEKFKSFLEKGEPPLNYERFLLQSDSDKDRVVAILEGKIVPPFEVEIQPSSLCNLRCKHCFGKDYPRIFNKMGKNEFDILGDRIDEFKENGFEIEIVKFCGTTGEPLVNPYTPYAIDMFRERGKKVVIFTNGLNLDKRVNCDGRRYYEYIPWIKRINLSLDAGSEEVFYNLKGRNGFDNIINSLEKISSIRDKEKTGLDIRVSYVIGEINRRDVVNAARKVKNAGANEIIFRVDFTDEKTIKNNSEEIIENINYAKEYQDINFKVPSVYSNKEISGEDCGFNSKGIKCFNQNFWACVGPDCELYACGHRTYSGIKSIGSLLENSFRELWLGDERKKLLDVLPDNACKNCSPSSKRRNDFMTFLSGVDKNYLKNIIYDGEIYK